MALINKIRDRATVAILVVAVAMAFFLLGSDFISSVGQLSNAERNKIGEINGIDIDRNRFANEVEAFKREMEDRGYPISPEQEPYARNQAWQRLVMSIVYGEEMKKLGLEVTDQEVVDMIQGNNIDPSLGEQFKNPQTGEIDRNQIIKFLKEIKQAPPEQQIQFYAYEQSLKPTRERLKYENLMMTSNYVTKAEAKRRYADVNTKMDLKYFYVPYTSIPDSAVEVTEAEAKTYFEANKDDFEQDPYVSLEYVLYEIKPSSEDSTFFRNELEGIKEYFSKSENDTLFTAENSDVKNNINTYRLNNIPNEVDITSMEKGNVTEPILKNGNYVLYKYLGEQEDTIYSMRARHILIKSNETDAADKRAEAKKKAQEILDDIKGGADFAKKAEEFGQDGTRAQGGDLGWFTEGQMVGPFEKAVMGVSEPKLIAKLVETQFGFHIVEVTEAKTKSQYSVATITRNIVPRQETLDEIYRSAGELAVCSSVNEFVDKVQQDKELKSSEALSVKRDDKNLGPLKDRVVREIVLWAFNEAEVGGISEAFEDDNYYVVALLKNRSEEGKPRFENVRAEVEQKLREEKKGEIILGKVQALKNTNVDEMVKEYGQGALALEHTDFSYTSLSLKAVGFAPKTIGKVATMDKGAISAPVVDEKGVIVVSVQDKSEAAEVAEYTTFLEQIKSDRSQSVSLYMIKAAQDLTDSEEKINKFY